MIKKRNLDNSLIQWIMTQTGLGAGVGEINYAVKATSATSQYRTQLQSMGVERDYKLHSTIDAAAAKLVDYRGDVLLVFPGSYAESITDNLYGSHMLGVGVMPGDVQIAPTANYAFNGGMKSGSIRNMMFLSPNTTNPTRAAVEITADMTYSIIDNCDFRGGHASCVAGLQILPQIGTSSWESMISCILSNNRVHANGTSTFQTGINLFADNVQTYQNKKLSTNSRITGNIISAGSTGAGIKLNSQKTNNRGLIIDHNYIRADETTSGPRWGIICRSTNGDDQTVQVCYNVIETNDVGIEGFTASSVFGNLVARGSGTATQEYPASS